MTNPLLKGLHPVHPGEILREDILPAVARPKAEIARMFGGSAESWVNMQRNYDLKIAERELAEELDKIPHLEAA